MRNPGMFSKTCTVLTFILLISGLSIAQCPSSTSVVTTESRCRENGTIKVTAVPANSYTYEITAGPTLSSATLSNTFTSLQAGTYEVTISKSGCFTTVSAVVPGNYTDPGLLSATSTGVTCPGGTACLTMNTPANGRSPYSYAVVAGPVTRPLQTSPSFCGLPAGDYTIQALDSCGVVRSTQYSIGVDTGDFSVTSHLWYTKFANCNDLIIDPHYSITGTTSPAHRKLKIWYVNPDGDTLKVNNLEDTSLIKPDTVVGQANKTGNWQILAYDECGRIRVSAFGWDKNKWGWLNLSAPDKQCHGYDITIWNSWQGALTITYRVRKCSDNSIVYEFTDTPPTTEYSPPIQLLYDTCYIFESFNTCGDTIRKNLSYAASTFEIAARPYPSCDDNTKGNIWFFLDNWASSLPVVYTIINGPARVGSTATIDATEWWDEFRDLPFGIYTLAAVDACGLRDTVQVDLHSTMTRTVTVTQTPNCSGGANVHLKVVTSTTGTYLDDAGGTDLVRMEPSYYTAINTSFVRPNGDIPGTYEADILNVTDNHLTFYLGDWNSCFIDTTVTINLYKAPTLNNVSGFVCNANSTGTINYNTLGGIAPFRYRIRPDSTGIWSPWQDSAIFKNISPGSYDVNVVDACPNGSIRSLTFYTWEKSSIEFSSPCATNGQRFTLSPDNKVFGVNYQWYRNNTFVGSGDSYTIPSFSSSDEGLYKLKQTFQGGVCVDSVSNWVLRCAILPLSFGELKGQHENKEAILQWNTFKDVGNLSYIVERSTDGIVFNRIAIVTSKENVNGSSYKYIDNSMPPVAFYRIRYLGMESKVFRSNTVRLAQKDIITGNISISPVPFKSWVTVKVKSDKAGMCMVKFFDMTGSVVVKKSTSLNKGDNIIWFDEEIAHLSAGPYVIEVSGDGFVQRNKVLKQ